MAVVDAARTPVLVGIGVAQRKEQDWRDALEPVALMQEAAAAALVDAGNADLAASIGRVIVPEGLWAYGDPARTVADAIGARQARTTLVKLGVLQQTGIGLACEAIREGSCEATVVVGGEARFRALRATIAGEQAPETPDDRVPDETLVPAEELYLDEETGSGLGYMPVNYYAIMDSAFRHSQGWSVDEGRDRIATLYSRFSQLSQGNPHAWKPGHVPAQTIRNPGERNPMLAFPYTRLHNTSWNVDQAGAMLFCSEALADRLGIAASHRVYPLASAQCEQMLSVAQRRHLERVPGVAAAARRLEQSLDMALADVDFVDLYSCFPVAVLAYAAELGLPLDRDLTVTGGMPFAGGPLNNYVIQASCRLAEQLRGRDSATGLVTSVSGLMTKQGLGLWSSAPPRSPFELIDVTAEVTASNPGVRVLPSYNGTARVAGYTVLYDQGERQRGVAMLDTPGGDRVIAWTESPELMLAMEQVDWVGRDVSCEGDQLLDAVPGA
jgi:acetyl-CoA C-acetyltransferase